MPRLIKTIWTKLDSIGIDCKSRKALLHKGKTAVAFFVEVQKVKFCYFLTFSGQDKITGRYRTK